MSTKVYTAYKIDRENDLFEIVRDIKKKALEEVKKVIYNIIARRLLTVGKEANDCKARWEAFDYIKKLYAEANGKDIRDICNFDVCLAIREYDRDYYIIPYCDMLVRHVFDFLKEDRRLEDFCYWNNSDKLEEVSEDDWSHRGYIWNILSKPNEWPNFLILEIMSYQAFYLQTPIDIHDISLLREQMEEIKKK